VEFRILGPIEVVDAGAGLSLGGHNQRTLLALLLLNVDEVVSSDRAIDALWGDTPPRTALTSVHNAVSGLRKLLGPERLVTRSPGYELRLQDDVLDVQRARQLADKARAAEAGERVKLLHEAEQLWRGPPLADFEYDEFAQTAIAQLDELRLGIVEDRIDAELEVGEHVQVLGELDALVAEHPQRERLRGQLMLALYRSGRQADALHAYQEARRSLLEDLGIEPGPALHRLHSAILRQERSLEGPVARAGPEDELEGAAAALLAGRLVPVLGSEVGELARQLAEKFQFPADEGRELTRIAQFATLMKGSGPLYDELHDLVASRAAAPTSIHRFFAALPALLRERGAPQQLILTTSYDLALEEVFLAAGEEFDVVSYLAVGPNRGRFCHTGPGRSAHVIDVPNTYATELDFAKRPVILKLHGGIDPDPDRSWESFVITEDDYIDYLPQSELATAVPVGLAARLRRSHFLFLGYRMHDWNLRLVLSRLWAGAPVTYRSWAVGPSPGPMERAFWRSRDVDLIDAPLEQYIDSLALHLGVGIGAAQ
jgi:DNA-binding SARP family transcriptional activator